jgi:hypothetical protein
VAEENQLSPFRLSVSLLQQLQRLAYETLQQLFKDPILQATFFDLNVKLKPKVES